VPKSAKCAEALSNLVKIEIMSESSCRTNLLEIDTFKDLHVNRLGNGPKVTKSVNYTYSKRVHLIVLIRFLFRSDKNQCLIKLGLRVAA